MNAEKELQARSGSICELCSASENLKVYEVPKSPNVGIDSSVIACSNCIEQLEDPEKTDINHWRCLNDSMWSQVPGVQVLAWRMLTRLRAEGWPQDLLDMLYLDDDTLAWAKATGEGEEIDPTLIHKDSNGAILQAGDSVVLIKDLDVKGANFTAKRGTAVRNISLVHDNPEHIEGRVSGQHIVILTKFVKKS
ncbi:alkylphosphonate utilization protein [Aquimarina sp. MMG016]|uniref:PhnA domain-containing protein n=1 Tax=Aquimarina sp. MMG016 TaxID=2822690 RepID=UPI001B3A1A36|nr:alkylphosphonate utilization protein [Aquimarina sp. MMG016]MBQ4819130.1 PhnA domain-containing protein [Aquimarina sp. MMG016]